jgi:xylose isomerase
MSEFFTTVPSPIAYEGPDSDNPLAFRWYDADRVVGDRTMAEHLRFAVAYWHSFNWDGFDIFGAGTMDRPWLTGGRHPMDEAKTKMAAAFEFFEKLGAPFFCFHDVDISAAASPPAASTSTPSCAASRASATTCSTLTSAAWTPWLVHCSRPTPC